MKYIKRIVDNKIDKLAKVFNAINIIGPKGCGKTRTAKERSNTIIEFQDEDKRKGYIEVVETSPSLLLNFKKPILFDEWQDAPNIWGAIRKACDDSEDIGSYYLTGSTSKKVSTPHSGTGRICSIEMFPMTLFESGESNGSISLNELLADDSYDVNGKISTLKIKDLIYSLCRGGWPRAINLKDKELSIEIAKDYFKQIIEKDISTIDNVKRNDLITKSILWSYARNVSTLVKITKIYNDVNSNYPLSNKTFFEYIDALERLFVIKEIDAWSPQIRSKSAIRGAKKRIFIDPSIAVVALGLSPTYFLSDFDLFGHLFENLVLRDLLAFASANGATLSHYSDSLGLEIDAIYQMTNGDYALIEIKTGTNRLKEAENNLNKFESLIKKYNSEHTEIKYREPKRKIIICGTLDIAYRTDSGVFVIPVGCLKD